MGKNYLWQDKDPCNDTSIVPQHGLSLSTDVSNQVMSTSIMVHITHTSTIYGNLFQLTFIQQDFGLHH